MSIVETFVNEHFSSVELILLARFLVFQNKATLEFFWNSNTYYSALKR